MSLPISGQGVDIDGLCLPAQHDGLAIGVVDAGGVGLPDGGERGLGGLRPVPGQLGGPAVDDDEALIRRVGEDVVDARGGGRVGVGNEGDVAPGAPDPLRVMEVDEGRVARRAGVAGIAGPFDFLVAGQRPQVAPVG